MPMIADWSAQGRKNGKHGGVNDMHHGFTYLQGCRARFDDLQIMSQADPFLHLVIDGDSLRTGSLHLLLSEGDPQQNLR
jgi:hypothetical protein